ncbi:G_PROTEIN_RECEP_F1_2 domain-containing protein [Meloidogyne graminicola]|uniref:G_PROTEIN_RECEP_F1_2 domain-containing protein n=1 Tax=Meloidogyne graminicola TaxID=189291 RepID=A0A8S9ZWK9_9BILA|nr:G_PROTEIN_RECEP_F1_2 domain-containing protein [Meloidogyne graminicola]
MDFYSQISSENHQNQRQIQQQIFSDNLISPSEWPVKIVNANIWPNFLWRKHPIPNNNQCLTIQSSFPEMVDLLPVQIIFSFLYLLIWLAAILGNFSVLYVVSLKQVQLSSVRSVFICSLAASDILMSMTSLPITAVSIFTRDWVFPTPFCKLIGIFQGGAVFVSSFTLTAIAVDRYILIKHPTKQKIKFRTALSIVAFLWVLGYSCAMPVGIFSSTVEYSPFCGQFCEENWPDTDTQTGRSRLRKYYGILVLIVQFGLPMLISCLCYWQIGRLIRLQMRRRSERQMVILQESKDRMKSQKNKTNLMMATMVAGLVLAWLPMNLINLWRDLNNENSVNGDEFVNFENTKQIEINGEINEISGNTNTAWFSLIFAASHSIAMTSVIYSFFNPQFRETIRKVLERRRQSQAAALMTTPINQNNNNNYLNSFNSNGYCYVNNNDYNNRRSSARSLLSALGTAIGVKNEKRGEGLTTIRNSVVFLPPKRDGKFISLLNDEKSVAEKEENELSEGMPGEML